MAGGDHGARDKQVLWHPFTQQQDWVVADPVVIDHGEGNWLVDTDGRRYLDGVSSLWCNVHGHRHPTIDAAVRAQLDRIAHSTLLGLTGPPAVEAAEAVLRVAPPGLTRCFFSENGAAAVEVALKMAYQYWQLRGRRDKRTFLALDQAYHGDTLGAVSVGGIDVFHAAFAPLLFQCFRAPTSKRRDDGTHPTIDELLAGVEAPLAAHAGEICAVVIEPLVQGAAGMYTFPDGYVRGVRELCDRYEALLICDEVATGFGRTGAMFASSLEGVTPDLMCVGKGITGGYLPMSATITTEDVYEAFLGPTTDGIHLFHGHTYSGNALAAAACVASLQVFEDEETLDALGPKIRRMSEHLARLAAHDAVVEVRQRGAMVGIELAAGAGGRELPARDVCVEARTHGVMLRPLEPVIVWMPPLSITFEEIELLAEATESALDKVCG